MPQFSNAMEVFKLLDKSNCRRCNEPTCLAFASKVFLGQKSLDRCPALDPEIKKKYANASGPRTLPAAADMEGMVTGMKQEIAHCDLEQAAERTQGSFAKGWLTLKVFGKPLAINNEGRIKTDLHVNPWMVVPILHYVLSARGRQIKGQWMAFRELKDAREKSNLFVRRVEEPLKNIADRYPALFEDLVDMFSGATQDSPFDADVSLVLYPLPLLPMMVCYWKPEEGMDSELTLFFDESADENGGYEMVFNLAAGMVRMFEKFAQTHGGA
jgi:hypothetical protein